MERVLQILIAFEKGSLEVASTSNVADLLSTEESDCCSLSMGSLIL